MATVGFLVDKDADARRGDGGAVEIIVAMDLCPGREIGVDAGTMKEIEGQ